MGELPGGIVTFLFADIEGSTALWERDPAAMKRALSRHDEIARETVAGANGSVFKHTGDGFAAVFTSPSDALAAATAFDDALTGIDVLDLRARIGVHTGESSPRDGDYFGQDVNRAARVMDAANGGQIVVSAATQTLVGRGVPEGASLVDAGEHRPKDLGEPIHLYWLVRGQNTVQRALRTLDAAPNNLPIQISSFVGRQAELEEVAKIVLDGRLTTLTGIGGVGKTRLALQVGARLLDRFPDGVWFFELASLGEPGLIPQTAMTTMQLKVEQGRPPIDQLVDEIQSKELLLIVDNCEHLIDDVAKFVDVVLRSAPRTRVIATSREGLAINGERLWRVPSLTVDGDASALELFEERARLVRADFRIDESNRESVVALCGRLDGIPLAIELATARLKMLDVQQIAEHLGDRFRLLTGGARTSVERQRTLLAMMDWSYDLLSPHEQALLRRLAVFAGGFALEAAEDVAAGDLLPRFEVLDLLGRLVETSLVTFVEEPMPRYRLLETVRQYGADRLAEAGEADEARLRHADFFGRLATELEPLLPTDHSRRATSTLTSELSNLRAAMTWAYDSGHADMGLRIAVAMRIYFFNRAAFQESLRWLIGGLDLVDSFESEFEIRALAYALTDAFNEGDGELIDRFTVETREVFDGVEDVVLKADLVNALAAPLSFSDPAASDREYSRAIDLYRRAGSDRWIYPLYNRFNVFWMSVDLDVIPELLGQLAEAERAGLGSHLDPVRVRAMIAWLEGRNEDGLELMSSYDLDSVDDQFLFDAVHVLVAIYTALGRYEEARKTLERVEELSTQQGDPSPTAWAKVNLLLASGDLDAVDRALEPIRKIARPEYSAVWRGLFAVAAATLASLQDDHARAARLAGYWDELSGRLGLRLPPDVQLRLEKALEKSRDALGDDFELIARDGWGMGPDELLGSAA